MMRYIRIITIFFFAATNISFAFQLGLYVESEPVNIFELNTKADDFAPRWNRWENKLYFNSTISGSSLFYTSEFNLNFSNATIIKSPINKPGDNRSYIAFANSDEAFVAKFANYKQRPYLNIYRSVFVKNGWSEPEIITSLMTEAFVSHPTISPDGNLLVFASNMGNQLNETDLWMSWRKEDNTWTVPIPIDELNSHGSEITPYLVSQDTLLFSSNGYEGPGGFDIFYSVLVEDKWERPRPIGGINTEFDESDPCMIPKGILLFSSNRPGGVGGLDLYSVKLTEPGTPYLSGEEIKLNLQFQVSNINIERQTVKYTSPAIKRIPKIYIDNLYFRHLTSNNIFSDYLTHLMEKMNANPRIVLSLESNEHGKRFAELFHANGIDLSRLKFEIDNNNNQFVEINISNCSDCELFEFQNYSYSLKPEMLDIAISAANLPAKYEPELIAEFKQKSELINLSSDTLPQRFLFPLQNYANDIFATDNIEFIFKIKKEEKIINSIYKNLFVTIAEITEEFSYFYENEIYKLYPLPSYEGEPTTSQIELSKLYNLISSDNKRIKKISIFYSEDINSKFARDISKELVSRFSLNNVRLNKIPLDSLHRSIDNQNAIFIGIVSQQ